MINTELGRRELPVKKIQRIGQNVLAKLKEQEYIDAFLDPVDHKGLGLTNYLDVVEKPMDISTVTKKLKNNRYKSLQDIQTDVHLIWTNCMKYNQEGSDIYINAKDLAKFST